MEKVFVIIECNAYDAFELPYDEVFYLSEEEAEKDCKELNRQTGSKRDYFAVHELYLKKPNTVNKIAIVSVEIDTLSTDEEINYAISKGIYYGLDVKRVAEPKKVKILTSNIF